MSALGQYLELYDRYRDIIDNRSTAAMNNRREAAYRRLAEIGSLPTTHTPGYEKTSLEDLYKPDFGINLNRTRPTLPDAQRLFRCNVPLAAATTAFVVNDVMMRIDNERLPEGVVFTSLTDTSATGREIIERHYGSIASTDNPAAALNTMLVQDGTLLYVPAGIKLERPIQIINLHSSAVTDLSLRRLLIVVGENAEANVLICDHSVNQTVDCAANEVAEIILEKNARLTLCDMEESSAATTRHFMLYTDQQSDSSLTINGLTLSAGLTRNEYYASMSGRGASMLLTGMAIGRDRQHIDNFTRIRHIASHCQSEQLFKYILDDHSTGAFEGDITVCPGAVKTAAYQTNRNLLASSEAKMHSQPQLLIYCDDVKCSHGAATGQLDADALFYMRQRGIPEKTARYMLMQAFMADVIDSVPIAALRERLRHMVEKQLHGEAAYCADCTLNSPDEQP
ncbi:MAG: Fe-S cluster assembly protein SufD [Muribaculum sp.]|nr:Fe-S cluster assembly protein SufD [Muribaculum sp.]